MLEKEDASQNRGLAKKLTIEIDTAAKKSDLALSEVKKHQAKADKAHAAAKPAAKATKKAAEKKAPAKTAAKKAAPKKK